MKATGSNILVRPIIKEKEGDIFLVGEDIVSGEILSIGEKVKDKNVGDTVFFTKFAYDNSHFFEYNGDKVLIVDDSSVEYFLKSK